MRESPRRKIWEGGLGVSEGGRERGMRTYSAKGGDEVAGFCGGEDVRWWTVGHCEFVLAVGGREVERTHDRRRTQSR